MKLIALSAAVCALAVADFEFEGDTALSLLQLRSSKKSDSPQHKFFSNASSAPSAYNGHPFGCTGRTKAVNVVSCGMYGDVHQYKHFNGGSAPNVDGTGWFWIAKSKDNSFQAQAFYRGTSTYTTMSHFAFKFGDQTVFLDRELEPSAHTGISRWIWKYFWNGQEKSCYDCPMEFGPVYWANKGAGAVHTGEGVRGEMANTGGQGSTVDMVVSGTGGQEDLERLSCFEFGEVSVWTAFQDWMNPSIGPYVAGALIEVEGSIDFLDNNFGQCSLKRTKVEPSDILVTIAQNQKVCSDDGLSPHQCEDPDPPPPPPTKEELCEKNGVDISHAEDLCADQAAHGSAIHDACMYDVCASIEIEAQFNAVGGAEFEAAIMNPEAKCNIKSGSCLPCNICSSSTSADLSNVVQNNLGGLGPDTGAEEIRYKNAIDLDGRKIDVVLTAQGTYEVQKVSKNGYSGTGFGRFLMNTKTSTEFKFSFVDSTTDEPVAVKDLALTFYDLDQAKKGRQTETISSCGAEEVYTTTDTELVHTASGACHSFTSSVIGTGKDNPATPDELTKTQAARSVTYEFHARASINFSASVSRSGRSPRPVLFSFVPQVACGASDAETRCA